MTPLPPNPDSPEEKRVQCDKCGAWQDERTCCGFCGRAIGFDSPDSQKRAMSDPTRAASLAEREVTYELAIRREQRRKCYGLDDGKRKNRTIENLKADLAWV